MKVFVKFSLVLSSLFFQIILSCFLICYGSVTKDTSMVDLNLDKFPPDIRRIKQRKKLIVAMLGVDTPPFFMQDKNQKLQGIDVELAQRMADDLGVELEINRQSQSFNEVVSLVSRGEADIGISKLSLTLIWAQKVKYSNPYVTLYKTVVFNRLELAKVKHSQTDTLEAVFKNKQRKIAVIKGSSYEIFAHQIFPQADVISFKSWELEVIPKLMSGGLLAAFQDDWEALKVIETIPKASLELLAVTMTDELDSIRMIVPWESVYMLEWINNFLKIEDIDYNIKNLLAQYRKFKSNNKPAQKP